MIKLIREEKAQIISMLKDKFLKAKGVIFTEYKGLTVTELTELRRSLKGFAIEYKVVKNTFGRMASAGTPLEVGKDAFKGTVGVAIGYDDPVTLAKKVLEFSNKNDKLKIMSGIIEGSLCNKAQVKAIADLPPREALLAILVGAMQAPISKFDRLFRATVLSFAYALNALKEKKSTGGV